MMISDTPPMLAVNATFAGRQIVLPDDLRGMGPGSVIVIALPTTSMVEAEPPGGALLGCMKASGLGLCSVSCNYR